LHHVYFDRLGSSACHAVRFFEQVSRNGVDMFVSLNKRDPDRSRPRQ
jgi:hypothetical protein